MRLWLVSCCTFVIGALSGALADDSDSKLLPTVLAYTELGGAFDGAHVSSGVDFALAQPIDARGFVIRISGNTGWSRFQIDPAYAFKISEISQSARLMLGWRETGSWGTVTTFAGLGIESRRLIPNLIDPHTGTRTGPAFAIDAWLTPLDRVAVQAYLGYTTGFGAWTVKIAPGYRLAANVHVGPEVTWSRHHESDRLRIGAHVTGLQLFDYGIRLSGGYAQDRGGKGGAYAALTLWHRY